MSRADPDAAVIDPADRRGAKNRYIARLRDRAITAALAGLPRGAAVLDLGCGTASLSAALVRSGLRVLGLDISPGLLARATQRGLGPALLPVCFDGHRIPLRDATLAGAATYVVLTHVLEDQHLEALLAEVRRVLQPGALFVAMEQARTRRTLDLAVWQCRRTLAEQHALFARAGFTLERSRVLRYGRFPTTPLIARGWIPRSWFGPLAALEAGLGRWLGPVPWDYVDNLFVLRRP